MKNEQATSQAVSSTKKKAAVNKEPNLEARINQLEAVIVKMAHYSGNNKILLEAGLEPYVIPKKKV